MPFLSVSPENKEFDWVRVSADFRVNHEQWSLWKMASLKLRLYEAGKKAKEQKFRINRILKSEEVKNIFLDIRAPKRKKIDRIDVIIENRQNEHNTWVDNLKIELFDKK